MLRSEGHELTSISVGGTFQKILSVGCRGGGAPGSPVAYLFAHLNGRLSLASVIAAIFMMQAPINSAAHASTIRITPIFNVSESYTDNVRAVAEGAEADLITETTAGVTVTADGNRLDLNLDLSAARDQYLDTDGLNGTRPEIIGISSAELFKDHFFLDTSVSMSEVSSSRDGAIGATDRTLPSNRTSLLLFEISPRFEYRFGRWLEATLQYDISQSRFSRPSAGDRTSTPSDDEKTDRVSLILDTGEKFTQIDSQLEVLSEDTKRGSRGKLSEDRIDLVNEYRINRMIGLIARGGYEDVSDTDDSLASKGLTWALGTHLQPGPRFDFRTEIGRRFGGSNVSATLDYEISSFYVLNASFTQSVETQQSSRLNRLNRLVTGPDGRLIDPFTGTFRDPESSNFDLDGGSFKEDSFSLGLTGTRGRNTVSLAVDLSNRESNNSTLKEEHLDVNLNLSRRMQPKLTGQLGLGYSDILSSSAASSGGAHYDGNAGLNYRLGETFTSSLEYSYLRRTLSSDDVTSENVVTLGLQASF